MEKHQDKFHADEVSFYRLLADYHLEKEKFLLLFFIYKCLIETGRVPRSQALDAQVPISYGNLIS
jgi:hypothetical protein